MVSYFYPQCPLVSTAVKMWIQSDHLFAQIFNSCLFHLDQKSMSWIRSSRLSVTHDLPTSALIFSLPSPLLPTSASLSFFFFFSQLFKSITLIEARTAVTSVGELPGIWEKRKAWSVLKLFSISIVLYITWVYTYVKISSCTLKTGTSYFI